MKRKGGDKSNLENEGTSASSNKGVQITVPSKKRMKVFDLTTPDKTITSTKSTHQCLKTKKQQAIFPSTTYNNTISKTEITHLGENTLFDLCDDELLEIWDKEFGEGNDLPTQSNFNKKNELTNDTAFAFNTISNVDKEVMRDRSRNDNSTSSLQAKLLR